jgi:hypothetical protein
LETVWWKVQHLEDICNSISHDFPNEQYTMLQNHASSSGVRRKWILMCPGWAMWKTQNASTKSEMSIMSAQKVSDFRAFWIYFGTRSAQLVKSIQIFQNLENSELWNTCGPKHFG